MGAMRSRALDVLIAAAAVYLACAIWLVTPWRPLLVASRALGLMRPSLSHVEVSPPRMSPDSTRFAYGLLVQEYSGDRAPVWSFPLDFFEFVRNYEVWVCDLRPGSKPRRVAWWPLRRDQSPFLANWLREGLIV